MSQNPPFNGCLRRATGEVRRFRPAARENGNQPLNSALPPHRKSQTFLVRGDRHESSLSNRCRRKLCGMHPLQSRFLCAFSSTVLQALNPVSHRSTLPAGPILFVEGQSPRGTFTLGSGKVNLSTTSREGKLLILKTAEAGEALGLGATISGVGCATTAETATPCQIKFVDRKHLLEMMGRTPRWACTPRSLSDAIFHSACRDIHDLELSRSSAANWRDCCCRNRTCRWGKG